MKKKSANKESIALIISSLKGGGAERIALNLANYFSKKFSKVFLIVLVDKIEYRLPISKDVIFINLKSKKAKLSIFNLIYQLNIIKPDYIFSLMRDSNILLSITNFFLYFEKKIIFREANSFKSLNLRNPITSNLLILGYKFLYQKSDMIIANSNDTKFGLIKNLQYQHSKIFVVGNPVLSDNFDVEKIKVAKHKWINNKNLKVIISAGRLHPQKDFPTLIKGFRLVLEKKSNFRLIICGEGDERKNLVSLIRKYNLQEFVHMIGFTNELYSYLKGSDIFCFTSLYEGFGNVIIEAIALGLPVISTSCDGISKEIINSEEIGSLVPIKRHDILANKILEKSKWKKNNKKNMEIALKYKVSKMGNKYYEVIKSINKNI